jgi:pimeloyl-ACP methyl ester carboxylesterase
MDYELKREKQFQYIEEGEGPVLILLHGLFGALSNWSSVIDGFKSHYKVVIPLMPIYDLPITNTGVSALTDFIRKFILFKNYSAYSLIGNSLGGHVALVYAKRHPENIISLILTGSSGLYENAMGGTFPRREDYNFIKEKVEFTFYDPKSATKELVDEVFSIINNKGKLIRILALAKSAIRHNMRDELCEIKMPTCLIWGNNDTITPPDVAEEFHSLLPDSDVFFIDKCGHAPMMEQPEDFNILLKNWMVKRFA